MSILKSNLEKCLALLLGFTVLITAFAGFLTPTAMSAAEPSAPSSTAVWDFTNVAADGGGAYGNGSWSWVNSTKTLSLIGLTHTTSANSALALPDGATVALFGFNSLHSTYNGNSLTNGINCADLTIAGTGSLTVTGGTSRGNISAGIYSSNLTISESTTVNASGGVGTVANTFSCGIYVDGNFYITDNAIVEAFGRQLVGPNSATVENSTSVGIHNEKGDLVISDYAHIYASGGIATYSYGITMGTSFTINDNAAVVVSSGNATSSSYGLHRSSIPYYFTINGGSFIAAGNTGAMEFSYTVPYKYLFSTSPYPGGTFQVSDGDHFVQSMNKNVQIVAQEQPTVAPSNPPYAATWDFRTVNKDGSGTGWSWNQKTKTLTLTNFHYVTSAAAALRLPDGSTIVLNGTNTIKSIYHGLDYTCGIWGIFNSITITGTGTLNIASGDSNYSEGIFASFIAINDNAVVNVNGGSARFGSSGITGSLILSDNAKVTVTGGSARSWSRGTTSIILIINDNASLSAISQSVTSDSYGIVASAIIVNGGSFTSIGNTSALMNDYVVPNRYRYWVSTFALPPQEDFYAVSDGNFIINSTSKYASVGYEAVYSVTVSSDGAGTYGSGDSFTAGETVYINAGAAPLGKQFKEWSSSPTVVFADKSSPNTTFTMPSSDVIVAAVFDNVAPTNNDNISAWIYIIVCLVILVVASIFIGSLRKHSTRR